MNDARCLYDAGMPPDQMKAVAACLQTGMLDTGHTCLCPRILAQL